jgi:hypothetical protein
MQHTFFGIQNAADSAYGLAAALSYWVFKCRDRQKSPAMGTKTWTFLESSIQNSAQVSTTLEDYLQRLATALQSHLRPAVLTGIVQPKQRILRVNEDLSELQELTTDEALVFVGWRDLLDTLAPDGFTEWDVLELCRSRAGIVQVLCRLRFEEDRAIGDDTPDDVLEVDAVEVNHV